VKYLRRSPQPIENVTVGREVVIHSPYPDASFVVVTQLRSGRKTRIALDSETKTAVFRDTDAIGEYLITFHAQDGKTIDTTGFYVNPDARESDLTRMGEDELRQLFPDGTPRIARSEAELSRFGRESRMGKELTPHLLILLLLLMCVELLLANRFYD